MYEHHLGIQQSEAETESANLASNFPTFEIKTGFGNCEATFGTNFADIMNIVRQMPDTFGLCGIIALHASGLLTAPDQWLDVKYDPIYLKRLFDNWWPALEGESSWDWFDHHFGDRIIGSPNDFAILNDNSTGNLLRLPDAKTIKTFDFSAYSEAHHFQNRNIQHHTVLIGTSVSALVSSENEGHSLAFLCYYPIQEGIHTHWLSAKPAEMGNVLVTGDLRPFGIDAVSILVPEIQLLESTSRVIGATPTTKLTKSLTKYLNSDMGNGRNLHTEDAFTANLIIRSFE